MNIGDKVKYFINPKYRYGYIVGYMYWPNGEVNRDVVAVQWFDVSDLDEHIVESVNIGDLVLTWKGS